MSEPDAVAAQRSGRSTPSLLTDGCDPYISLSAEAPLTPPDTALFDALYGAALREEDFNER